MKQVFADTHYWLALYRPDDPWKAAAHQARRRLKVPQLVATDEVPAEFLTGMSPVPRLRQLAARVVTAILDDPEILVLPQSHDSLLAGPTRYAERIDKQYSLVDCVSMNAMEALSIRDTLTNDHPFTQEGFHILIPERT